MGGPKAPVFGQLFSEGRRIFLPLTIGPVEKIGSSGFANP